MLIEERGWFFFVCTHIYIHIERKSFLIYKCKNINIYMQKNGNKIWLYENAWIRKNTKSSEDDFIYSLNFFPMLIISVFKPSLVQIDF